MSPMLHKLLLGALTGWASAALTDYHAFQQFQSFEDAKTYNWQLAGWRWLKGTVTGVVVATGFDTVGL